MPGTKPTPYPLGWRIRPGEPEQVVKALGTGRLLPIQVVPQEGAPPMLNAPLAIHQLITMPQAETHQAPEQPFTTDQAHAVMQLHMACRAKCPRKAAEFETLIAAGRPIPSASKPR